MRAIDEAEHIANALKSPFADDKFRAGLINQVRDQAIAENNTELLKACDHARNSSGINAKVIDWIRHNYAKLDKSLIIGDAVNKGGDSGREKRAQNYGPEKELWRDTAKSILAGRKHKPGARELARLVGSQLNQLDKADSRRKWIDDLL